MGENPDDADQIPPTCDDSEPEKPKERVVYGDDYFRALGGFCIYKPGQEELKSYIGK